MYAKSFLIPTKANVEQYAVNQYYWSILGGFSDLVKWFWNLTYDFWEVGEMFEDDFGNSAHVKGGPSIAERWNLKKSRQKQETSLFFRIVWHIRQAKKW